MKGKRLERRQSVEGRKAVARTRRLGVISDAIARESVRTSENCVLVGGIHGGMRFFRVLVALIVRRRARRHRGRLVICLVIRDVPHGRTHAVPVRGEGRVFFFVAFRVVGLRRRFLGLFFFIRRAAARAGGEVRAPERLSGGDRVGRLFPGVPKRRDVLRVRHRRRRGRRERLDTLEVVRVETRRS